jgi:ABC-2 type transport system permease protein
LNGTTPEPAAAPAFLPIFFRLKWRLLDNHLANLRKHMWIHLAIALVALGLLMGGGTALFNLVFGVLKNLDFLGDMLTDHLIKMVLLAFFSMLIFSNLIIMLTTTYLSGEVEYLMSQPIVHRQLFFGKLGESIVYSSWAFLLLSCPLFVAMGQTHELNWTFYAGAAGLIVPFLVLPAAIGALIALIVTVYFPPRQIIRFAVVMVGIGIVGAAVAQRYYGMQRLLGLGMGAGEGEELGRLMRVLGFGDLLVLPSGWLGRGLTALRYQNWSEAGFWGLALWSSAAMGIVVLDWLAGPLYYRGWCSVRASGTTRRSRRWGFYLVFDRLGCWLPSSTRALVSKDLAVFWRDPAQWSQLLILFGLMFIYIANLRSAAGMVRYDSLFPGWRTLLAMFNIGATTFVLSILTTRFVFPMLSLEGKQQWVIGLAPVGRTRLVWVKFFLSWFSSTSITLPLALLSSYMLQTEAPITVLSIMMVLFMSVGLSALAVGFGALMPSFNDDNPARIASGLGGTINAVVSLIYIGLSLVLVAPWVQGQLHGAAPSQGWLELLHRLSIPAWFALQAAAILIPLTLGLRRWRRMEF